MSWINDHGVDFALLFARLCLGFLFLFQGYDKLFGLGIPQVSDTFKNQIRTNKLPQFTFPVVASYSSIAEFTGGILLILGLFTPVALILLSIDILMVIVAMSIMEPVWDMKLVFPRIALIIFLWLTLHAKDIFSLDYLLKQV